MSNPNATLSNSTRSSSGSSARSDLRTTTPSSSQSSVTSEANAASNSAGTNLNTNNSSSSFTPAASFSSSSSSSYSFDIDTDEKQVVNKEEKEGVSSSSSILNYVKTSFPQLTEVPSKPFGAGSKLYHCSKVAIKTVEGHGIYVSANTDQNPYGPHIHTFQVKEDLTLMCLDNRIKCSNTSNGKMEISLNRKWFDDKVLGSNLQTENCRFDPGLQKAAQILADYDGIFIADHTIILFPRGWKKCKKTHSYKPPSKVSNPEDW